MKCCSFILKRIRGGLKVMKATPPATELRVEIKTRAFEVRFDEDRPPHKFSFDDPCDA
jgi:hypothetical protein